MNFILIDELLTLAKSYDLVRSLPIIKTGRGTAGMFKISTSKVVGNCFDAAVGFTLRIIGPWTILIMKVKVSDAAEMNSFPVRGTAMSIRDVEATQATMV